MGSIQQREHGRVIPFRLYPGQLNRRQRPAPYVLRATVAELVAAHDAWRQAHTARVECGRRLRLG